MTKGKNSLVHCTNLLYILAYLYHFLLRHEDFLKARLMAQVSGGDPAKDKYGGLRERRQVAESREPQPSQSEGTSSGVKSLHDLQQRTERQLDSISSRLLSPPPTSPLTVGRDRISPTTACVQYFDYIKHFSVKYSVILILFFSSSLVSPLSPRAATFAGSRTLHVLARGATACFCSECRYPRLAAVLEELVLLALHQPSAR